MNFIVKMALLLKTIFGERYYFLEGKGYSKIEYNIIFTITLFSGRQQNIHKVYKSSPWIKIYMYICNRWQKLINSFS